MRLRFLHHIASLDEDKSSSRPLLCVNNENITVAEDEIAAFDGSCEPVHHNWADALGQVSSL